VCRRRYSTPASRALPDLVQDLGKGPPQVHLLEVLERPAVAHHRGEGGPLLALCLGRVLGRDEM
jgi:hypothetical protein